MPDDPNIPIALTSDGVNLATLDASIVALQALIDSNPIARMSICAELRERFERHQKLVDEHGTAANVNAAATLRLIMIQIGCTDIPDHR